MTRSSFFPSGAIAQPAAAGWFMMAGGLFGLVAFVALAVALANAAGHAGASGGLNLLLRAHGAAGIALALLMIPGVYALHDISRQAASASSRAMIPIGVGANLLLAACLASTFVTGARLALYLYPLGVVGIWLIVTIQRLPITFSKASKIAGLVAGICLVAIAVAYAIAGIAPYPNLQSALETAGLAASFAYAIWAILTGLTLARR